MEKKRIIKKEKQKILNKKTKNHDIAIEKISKLYKLATRDPKTGLYNAGFFYNELNHEISVSFRYSQPLSIILIDIDNFKEKNTEYGYLKADEILIKLSKIILQARRNTDIAARFGGEEFVILLPETTEEKAIILAERIRTLVFNNNFLKKYGVTISLGVSSIIGKTNKKNLDEIEDYYKKIKKFESKEDKDVFSYLKKIDLPENPKKNKLGEILFEKANIALKYSKSNGKNRTTIYKDELLKFVKKKHNH